MFAVFLHASMIARSTANFASITINGAAALLGLAGLIILIELAQSERALAGVAIYGVTLVLAYSSSALYHGTRNRKLGPLFQAVDHCTIYLLIAGTYTPFAVLALWEHHGPLLLGTVWFLALAGIAVRIFWIRRLHRVAPALYVLLGWIGLGWAMPFAGTLGRDTLVLLVAGGFAYTAGAAFVSRVTFTWGDVLWHLCAVIGSVCHFVAVVLLLGSHGG